MAWSDKDTCATIDAIYFHDHGSDVTVGVTFSQFVRGLIFQKQLVLPTCGLIGGRREACANFKSRFTRPLGNSVRTLENLRICRLKHLCSLVLMTEKNIREVIFFLVQVLLLYCMALIVVSLPHPAKQSQQKTERDTNPKKVFFPWHCHQKGDNPLGLGNF